MIEAVENVEVVRTYVARDSVLYAALLVERIVAAVDRLELFPELGRAELPRGAQWRLTKHSPNEFGRH